MWGEANRRVNGEGSRCQGVQAFGSRWEQGQMAGVRQQGDQIVWGGQMAGE